MRRFTHRLLNVIRSRRADEELTRELKSHLALLEEAHRRRGLTPDVAVAACAIPVRRAIRVDPVVALRTE